MSKQLEVNHQSLLDAYFDYYKAKLSSREHFENIIKIDNDQYEYDHFVIENNAELILKDSFNPIQNLLFLFRSNPHYITTLVSILDEKMAHDAAKTNPSLDSIVNLFCHQFYDNILIPNPEQEELLILCYLLLQKEINGMNNASVSSTYGLVEASLVVGLGFWKLSISKTLVGNSTLLILKALASCSTSKKAEISAGTNKYKSLGRLNVITPCAL